MSSVFGEGVAVAAAAEEGRGEVARVALAEMNAGTIDAFGNGSLEAIDDGTLAQGVVVEFPSIAHEARGGDEPSAEIDANHLAKVSRELEGGAAHGAADVQGEARGGVGARGELHGVAVFGAQVGASRGEAKGGVGASTM